jgi:hypothetical protein
VSLIDPAAAFSNGALALLSAALGVGLLRVAWPRRGAGGWLTAAGWLAFLGGLAGWHRAGFGWDEAIAYAMLAPSLIAFLFLAHQTGWGAAFASVRTVRRRRDRERSPAMPRKSAKSDHAVELQDPAQTPLSTVSESSPRASLARGTARFLLAGPVALAAALALAALIALRTPWLEADRLVAAGFLLPIVWAAGAIWATMDSKLTRVAVALSLTAIVCVGGAIV